MTGTYANSMMSNHASAMSAEASFTRADFAANSIVIILGAIIMASIFVSLISLLSIVLVVLVLGVLLITGAQCKRFERRKAS